jgi:hypothetical protein
MQKKSMHAQKWPGLAVAIAIFALIMAFAIYSRDADIQAEREESKRLIRDYETKVKKADEELRALESQKIAFSELEMVSRLQGEIISRVKPLIELAPILKNPEKADKTSTQIRDLLARYDQSYINNLGAYPLQMSQLNNIINRANKQYAVKVVKPSYLDRESLSSRRKFGEIIGLSKTPALAPLSQIEEINKGISSRSDKQKATRIRWNSQALKINRKNKIVNSQLNEITRLYPPGPNETGVKIEKAVNVKIVD